MKRDEIEAKLKDAVSNAAPDVLEDILRKCDEKKGAVIEMEQNTNKNRGKNKKNSPKSLQIQIKALSLHRI